MARDFRSLANAIEYMEKMGPELYELEKRIKEIKNSKEFKQARNIMSTYENRGVVDVSPSFKNGYSLPSVIDYKGEELDKDNFLKKFS